MGLDSTQAADGCYKMVAPIVGSYCIIFQHGINYQESTHEDSIYLIQSHQFSKMQAALTKEKKRLGYIRHIHFMYKATMLFLRRYINPDIKKSTLIMTHEATKGLHC